MSFRRELAIYISGFITALGIALLVLGSYHGSYIPVFRTPIFSAPKEVDKTFSDAIIGYTNTEREKAGLGALKENSALDYAAYLRARDILKFQNFSHEATRGGEIFNSYAGKAVGYRYQIAGENLALSYTDPKQVVSEWMRSSSHKENIMDGKFDETGVSVLYGTYYGVASTNVIVQLFGSLH